MDFLYNVAIRSYAAGVRLAALKHHKASLMVEGHRQTLKRIREARETIAPHGFDVWIHAASLGEFEQARPLITSIRQRYPDKRILLSFFSPSGYTVRHNYAEVDLVVYLPFDTPRNARQFVEAVNPQLAVFVKYEFWGNILGELARRSIPTYLISAIFRPSQIFFKPWGGAMRKALRSFAHIYLQDSSSKDLLASIGYDAVSVVGDTRLDQVINTRSRAKSFDLLDRWTRGDDFTIVVGSSWQQDEAIYIPWLKSHKDVKAIIAPHEFDDKRLDALVAQLGGTDVAMLWSKAQTGESIPAQVRYIIIDCFGILSSLYKYGKLAIIGGGFGAGIHNIAEAAVYGMPVLFGPRHGKFREATDLLRLGGAVTYSNEADFAKAITPLYSDNVALQAASDVAEKYIETHIGATSKIFSDLFGDR